MWHKWATRAHKAVAVSYSQPSDWVNMFSIVLACWKRPADGVDLISWKCNDWWMKSFKWGGWKAESQLTEGASSLRKRPIIPFISLCRSNGRGDTEWFLKSSEWVEEKKKMKWWYVEEKVQIEHEKRRAGADMSNLLLETRARCQDNRAGWRRHPLYLFKLELAEVLFIYLFIYLPRNQWRTRIRWTKSVCCIRWEVCDTG